MNYILLPYRYIPRVAKYVVNNRSYHCALSSRIRQSDTIVEQLPDVVDADSCFSHGDFANARNHLNRSLDIFSGMPSSVESKYMVNAVKRRIVGVCEMIGDVAEGERLLLEILSSELGSEEEYLMKRCISRLYIQQNRPSEALKYLSNMSDVELDSTVDRVSARVEDLILLGIVNSMDGANISRCVSQFNKYKSVSLSDEAEKYFDTATNLVKDNKDKNTLKSLLILSRVNRGASLWLTNSVCDSNSNEKMSNEHRIAILEEAKKCYEDACTCLGIEYPGRDNISTDLGGSNISTDSRMVSSLLTSLGHICYSMNYLDEARFYLESALRHTSNKKEIAENKKNTVNVLHGYDDDVRLGLLLTHLATLSHMEEKAVTAEGLYRSALDYFARSSLNTTNTISNSSNTTDAQLIQHRQLSPMFQWAHAFALDGYSKLLNDWENRGPEGKSYAEKSESIMNHLHQGSESDALITPHVMLSGWSPFYQE